MIVNLLLFCDLILVLLVPLQSQQIGEECILCKTGEAGIWAKVYSCEYAIEERNSNGSSTGCQIIERLDGDICCPIEEVFQFSRISEKKCAEYASSVFRQSNLSNFTFISKPRCDFPNLSWNRPVEEGEVMEFPHMALIGYGKSTRELVCAGSLISDLYVLAPAHCQENREGIVLLDGVDTKNSQEFNIASFITFPSYVPGKSYHDIGLIKLDRKVEFSPTIRPACLPTYFDDPITTTISTSYALKVSTKTKFLRLLKAKSEKIDYAKCKGHENYLDPDLLPNGVNNWTNICVTRERQFESSLLDDIKGPLHIYHHSRYCMYSLIGVNSHAIGFGDIGMLEIYTRVAPYMNWIEEIVWPSH